MSALSNPDLQALARMQRPDYAMRVIGHTSSMAVRAVSSVLTRAAGNRRGPHAHTEELDRTGILVEAARRLEIIWEDEHIIFPFYEESLAHSFWRAQEFSLLRRARSTMQAPVLDFGCGDGSFAAVLFDRVDYGVDIDQHALDVARQFDIYTNLVLSQGTHVPLPDGVAGTVFSNSVLEHVAELDKIVGEISRLLRPGGLFQFTVPVAQFRRDLDRYFGRAESERLNADYFHRNLLEISDWRALLSKHGLSVVSVQEYQPARFSFYYMMFRFLGNRVIGRFFRDIRRNTWKRHGPKIAAMVKQSIDGTVKQGGNIFVVAQKLGG